MFGYPQGIDIYVWIWVVVGLISLVLKSPPWLKPATTPHTGRIRFLASILTAIWLFVLWGLSTMWYGSSSDAGFHWYNDNGEWLQVDKVGHFFTTFQEARLIMIMWVWTGISRMKASWIGAVGGFLYQTPIELLDGFQDAYGASWGDLTANTLGAVFFYLQVRFWSKLRIVPKFSVSAHEIAGLRPGLFGANFFQQILKDYNGQTYWLTFHIQDKFPKLPLPAWLCLSIGYSGEGMIGGHDNTFRDAEGVVLDYTDIPRYRQWFLSIDIDWDKVPRPTGWLKSSIDIVSLVKLPAPALEWSHEEGFRWHWIYF
jgi:hypothetical protein